jgi:hypothetical protein
MEREVSDQEPPGNERDTLGVRDVLAEFIPAGAGVLVALIGVAGKRRKLPRDVWQLVFICTGLIGELLILGSFALNSTVTLRTGITIVGVASVEYFAPPSGPKS